ncbi:TonB-dependent receptor plug domain-containing protein [Roseateles sp. BYS180W]|uniref:TonB-dependent receptor plug domain-containing protein n=1 Tax=Roseateles rivi TaxID=3299028 RepID=A0ABW7FQS4_9BURK
MKHRLHLVALATIVVSMQAQAQSAPVGEPQKLEKVQVTGSLIKRVDRETPSVVQRITSEDIKLSGYASVTEMLRSVSAVDSSSVGDGTGTGFVSGLSTISLRGMGSQGTLTLINGRRIAPAAAVDINFGRGNLINVNTIPKAAIASIEILKDGASSLYGSDAVAGVVNYVLKKEYNGVEGSVEYGAAPDGVGQNKQASMSFGFGNLDTQRFNIFGGFEVSRRDPVMLNELKDRGNLELMNRYLIAGNGSPRFSADSVASPWGNYYKLPTSLSGSTTIDGVKVNNNSTVGVNYLGTLPGCPDDLRVGAGVPKRPEWFSATTGSQPVGMCRFNSDEAAQAISKQDKFGGSLRGTYQVNDDWQVFADLMVARTRTTETFAPQALTTTLGTASNPNVVTWPKLDGTMVRYPTIVLPVGHPDNPTNGKANSQPVQLIYRFADIDRQDIATYDAARFSAGFVGVAAGWDLDSAFIYSRQNSERVRQNQLRASLLKDAIKNQTYRFGQVNDAAAIATVASDAIVEGNASIMSADLRASRPWFDLPGGKAGVAVGAEFRRETLEAAPNEAYQSGDFVGLVANGTSGARNSTALFGELSLPVFKSLELQTALRTERYSDFGNATTGKLGFKWSALPSILAFRGTAATGFRAPSISQISKSYMSSFHSFSQYRVVDPVRCDVTDPKNPVSRTDPPNSRDCNVLGFSSATPNPGSLPTTVAANPNLKPEKSHSFTLGLLFSPFKNADLTLDGWYYKRNNEVRVQRGVDLLADYAADPATWGDKVIRDSDPATWVVDKATGKTIPNSGPILMLVRQYRNFNWTKTAGLDYELNLRLPTEQLGQFTFKVDGTLTKRFDYKILSTDAPTVAVGTTSSDIPKSKVKVTLSWKKNDWSSFVRFNHEDKLKASTTDTCLSSTAANYTLLRDNALCYVTAKQSTDVGLTYRGFKGLTLSASVLNVGNQYGYTLNGPAAPGYYDGGSAGQVGRRYNLVASYEFR